MIGRDPGRTEEMKTQGHKVWSAKAEPRWRRGLGGFCHCLQSVPQRLEVELKDPHTKLELTAEKPNLDQAAGSNHWRS